VKKNTVGDYHPILCQTYTCQSVIQTVLGNHEKALEYNQLAVDIFKVIQKLLYFCQSQIIIFIIPILIFPLL
jgi:hypothetical protein